MYFLSARERAGHRTLEKNGVRTFDQGRSSCSFYGCTSDELLFSIEKFLCRLQVTQYYDLQC